LIDYLVVSIPVALIVRKVKEVLVALLR